MARTIKKGSTSQSIYFEILDSTSTTGGRKTGLTSATVGTAYYLRTGGSPVSITLSALAAINSAWTGGGFIKADDTNMPGIYRLDVPDAAFATGAENVVIVVRGGTGAVQVSIEVQLVDNVTADVYTRLGAPAGASVSADVAAVKVDTAATKTDTTAINAKTASLTFTTAGKVDATIQAAGDFAQAAADKVWSTAARALTDKANFTLSSAGIFAIWDAAVASLTTVGSIGKRLVDNVDATVSSRLSSAGYTAPDNATITTINAKTTLIPGTQDGKTFAETILLMASVLLGKASGLGTATAVFRSLNDTKDRVTTTVDASGNRTATTLDAS